MEPNNLTQVNPHFQRIVVFVDSIFFASMVRPENILTRKLRSVGVGDVVRTRRANAGRRGPAWRLAVHQPSAGALGVLQAEQDAGRVSMNAVHVACDFIVPNAAYVPDARAWVDHHVAVPNVRTFEPGHCQRTAYLSRDRHAAVNLATYDDRPSKANGSACVHCELRLSRQVMLRRSGIDQPAALASADLAAVFTNRVKFESVSVDAGRVRSETTACAASTHRVRFANRRFSLVIRRLSHDLGLPAQAAYAIRREYPEFANALQHKAIQLPAFERIERVRAAEDHPLQSRSIQTKTKKGRAP